LSTKHPRLFQLALALLLLLLAFQCRNGVPISFDLMALLPKTDNAPLRQLAEQRTQQPLARQMLALVAHQDSAQALSAAQALAQRWRQSGLFADVELEVAIDLNALREALLSQRLSLLPVKTQEQLLANPSAYLKQRAAQLAEPFSAAGVIPLSQDWLGFAQQAQNRLQTPPASALSYEIASGTLQIRTKAQTSLLLRAQTLSDAFAAAPSQSLAEQIQQDRAVLAKEGAQLLVAGGPLYAEAGRGQAIEEISLIGSLSLGGIVLLLLLALRRLRALLALLPVLVGLLCGFASCVALFGSIHILTLVIGASLIGVAVDFPLHWLGKSYAGNWQAQPALRKVLPGLVMSLLASLIGYLSLLFTPFIALTQTAIFSAAGLLGAFACTLWQLPTCFERFAPRPWPPLLMLANGLLNLRQAPRPVLGLLALLLVLITAGGLQRLSLKDDLRQWLALPPALLEEARQIGEQTGLMPTSQFFLVQAPNEDALLQRQGQLARKLDKLIERGELGAYNALSQLVAPQAEQRALQSALASWQEDLLQPLTAIGIPPAILQTELANIQQLPPVRIKQALQNPAAERWRSLWLGEYDGQSAALVTLFNLKSANALNGLAETIEGAELIDRSGELNQLFSATRIKAGELKLLSYLAAALLLWFGLGRSAVWRILSVPLLACVLCLGVLGWLGQPLTLFSLFGLLLVSALGVDYAIFMYQGVGGAAVSLVGVLLSGATTLLSFGLLALSQTPVIAGFGLTLTLGIGFSLLLAIGVKRPID